MTKAYLSDLIQNQKNPTHLQTSHSIRCNGEGSDADGFLGSPGSSAASSSSSSSRCFVRRPGGRVRSPPPLRVRQDRPHQDLRLSLRHRASLPLVSPASLFLVAPLSHPRSSATKSGLRPLLRWRSEHRQVGRRPDRPLHRSRYTTILFLSFHFLFPFLFSL